MAEDTRRDDGGRGAGEDGKRAGGPGPEPHAEPLRDSPLHPPLAESGDAWDATTPAGNVAEAGPEWEGPAEEGSGEEGQTGPTGATGATGADGD